VAFNAQLLLQRGLVAGGLKGLLQFADGLAQRERGIAFGSARCQCGVAASTAAARLAAKSTFQAWGPSSRAFHQARAGANSSNCSGAVLLYFAALGQRQLVVPDGVGGAAALEEQQVGGDVGVGREHALRQAHDGVELELLEHLLLDDGADAVAKQGAVGHDHGGTATGRQACRPAPGRRPRAACA
jgi:hypothetical protein